MATGTVKWFDEKKGFGFITEDGGRTFLSTTVPSSATASRKLAEGDKVTFDIKEGAKGPQADQVQAIRELTPCG